MKNNLIAIGKQLVKKIHPYSHYLLYGSMMALLVFVLKWLEWKFLVVDHAIEIYTGLVAVFFTVLGVWIATQLVKPKTRTLVIEKEVLVPSQGSFALNEAEIKRLNLSEREYEVLLLLAKGYSNAAIAAELFLSVSTIKTHVSNLFTKLEVKSRTQTIEKAKRLRVIP